MGLKERRLIQQITETALPEAMRDLNSKCGAEIPIEIVWSTFEHDAAALERLPPQCLDRLTAAINWLCQDDIGASAVRNGIARIVIRNVATPSERQLNLTDGILTICGVWNSAHWDGLYHQSEIHAFLEANL